MGILNVTPDSFSDGGRHVHRKAAVAHALQMVADGASLIDIGGESTRPGAQAVGEQEEIDRVVPVIEAVRACSDAVISIDTMKPGVMRAACAVGAELVNDVAALQVPGAIAAVTETGAAVCLMHMLGEPRTMQQAPHYDDVVEDVGHFLQSRVDACLQSGISRDRLLIDPGIGFGKTLDHNLRLLAAWGSWRTLDLPVLIGVSRKSMFGTLLGRDVDQRLAGSITVAALSVWQGAAIVRVHDVAETVDAVRTAWAIRQAGVAHKGGGDGT